MRGRVRNVCGLGRSSSRRRGGRRRTEDSTTSHSGPSNVPLTRFGVGLRSLWCCSKPRGRRVHGHTDILLGDVTSAGPFRPRVSCRPPDPGTTTSLVCSGSFVGRSGGGRQVSVHFSPVSLRVRGESCR